MDNVYQVEETMLLSTDENFIFPKDRSIDILPLEIVEIIFEYYLSDEDERNTIPTLSLVCQSWQRLVKDNASLWGRIRLYIGHFPSWRNVQERAKYHLQKSGSAQLHIDVRITFFTESGEAWMNKDKYRLQTCGWNRSPINRQCPPPLCACSCPSIAEYSFGTVLRILAGENGEHCTRWKSLILRYRRDSIRVVSQIAKPLSYSMPNLTYLWLDPLPPPIGGLEPPKSTPPSDTSLIASGAFPSTPPLQFLRLGSDSQYHTGQDARRNFDEWCHLARCFAKAVASQASSTPTPTPSNPPNPPITNPHVGSSIPRASLGQTLTVTTAALQPQMVSFTQQTSSATTPYPLPSIHVSHQQSTGLWSKLRSLRIASTKDNK